MSKKLAILGHPTRGKEVIELLEMMGGKISNECTYESGFVIDYFFFICEEEKNLIDGISYKDKELLSNYICFTFEEFLEKYPFRVGDKVYTKSNAEGTIIDMFWDGIEVLYQLSSESVNALGYFHANELKSYKEEVNMKDNKLSDTISKPVESKSNAVGLKDGKVIDNSIDAAQFMQMGKTIAVIFNDANYEDEVELQLGDYEIEVRDGKTYAVKKKPKYPTTIEECVKLLGVDFSLDMVSYKRKLMANFYRLIICRDAYWKIAGEQMGLNKPWEPNWDGVKLETKYVIYNQPNTGWVRTTSTLYRRILSFPNPEMRDAFYENFKDLIEQCKEFL